MRLSDNVIGHIAKIVQLAILTGTDIVDHMRMIRLNLDTETLELDPEYEQESEENIARMIQELSQLREAAEES